MVLHRPFEPAPLIGTCNRFDDLSTIGLTISSMRFEVKLDAETIGYTELEAGDPPMGVAGGKFLPTAAYASIQPHCIQHRENWTAIPGLSVSTPDGVRLECSGPILILDFTVELGESEIEIEVCGITSPPYAKLFPHHVEAYKKQFR
jgi:hypothetical protein